MPMLPSQQARLRPEKLAIPLADLDRLPGEWKQMIASRLNTDDVLRLPGPKGPIPALGFKCRLLWAASSCDVIREQDRQLGEPVTVVYILRRGTWTRLANDDVLCVIADGLITLNPVIFPPLVAPTAKPLKPRRVI